jgi:hypothetical protein
MSRSYDVQKVSAALDQVIESNPLHTDRRASTGKLGCRYMEHGEPACLVACVMAQLGVSLGVLKMLDDEGTAPGSVQLRGTIHPIRKRFTPSAWDLLVYLQRENDAGWEWDRCRQHAFDPKNRSRRFPRSWMAE